MKQYELGKVLELLMSRPAWGAWIETSISSTYTLTMTRRAPRGARGLKRDGKMLATGETLVAPRVGRVD